MKTIEELAAIPSDINEHLPLLAELATDLVVFEIGFRTGVSARAFLTTCERLISCDTNPCEKDRAELEKEYPSRFTFIHKSSADFIQPCDMLFIDGDHSFDAVTRDLEMHAWNTLKYLVLHDTNSAKCLGVRNALITWHRTHRHWRVRYDLQNNNGLAVLERESE